MQSWKVYLGLVIIALLVQAFFSMMEMALVSFNKVRLQYYLEKEKKKAKWINHLLQHPAKLFGTTLIGVNFALQFGSECSRRLYESFGFDPDLSPLTQVFIVLVFAELAPMFAARRYPEHVCMTGIPLIYISSMIMAPMIWCFDQFCRLIHKIFGLSQNLGNYLTREELQKAIESRREPEHPESDEFDHVIANIFSLKNKFASDLIIPFSDEMLIASQNTAGQLKQKASANKKSYYLVYELEKKNIIGIAFVRDFLRVQKDAFVGKHCRTPWFITDRTAMMVIVNQFRWNNQNLAIVLDDQGFAKGYLSLDTIVREIFRGEIPEFSQSSSQIPKVILDRTFSGDTLIYEIQEQLGIHFEEDPSLSLEDVFIENLHHHPTEGDSMYCGDFILTVVDAPLIGPIQVNIQTR